MSDAMSFPATVEEFMEQYKIVDREEVYTNGAEMVPIFRMKQWFEHEALGKDTNVPGNSALDHIHNVVADNERKRGYEQAKAEYDHKLTEIKSRIKDHYYNKGYAEGYEQGKKDVPDMNVGDMIYRQAAMEMLMAQNVIMDGSEYHNGFNAGVNRAQEVIRNLPSVQPKRGKWIERNPLNSDKCRLIECDQCGKSYIVGFNVPYEHWIDNRNYCEKCGADMRGEADGHN